MIWRRHDTDRFRTVFKLFWAWKDEELEEWLRKKSMEGWHLVGVTRSGLRFHFVKGEPANYIYRLDYKATKDDDLEEYLHLFEEAGWQYIDRDIMWRYFRILGDESGKKEIYSDPFSKITRNQNLIRYILYFVFLNLFFVIYDSVYATVFMDTLGMFWMIFMLACGGLNLTAVLVCIYSIYRLKKRNKQLRRGI